jgi:hypothetical protein
MNVLNLYGILDHSTHSDPHDWLTFRAERVVIGSGVA